MKVYMVGAIDQECAKELAETLDGQPTVLLTGSIEEVRAAAAFMFNGEVTIGPKDAPTHPIGSATPEGNG